MKYIFTINSRVKLSEMAEAKHQNVINFLKDIGPPWGLNKDMIIPFPGFGRNEFISFTLNKFIGKGIKMTVFYRYRNELDDHHLSDDRIFIEFDTKKFDYNYIVETIFPYYIKHFNAYSSSIYPEALIYTKLETPKNNNRRKSIKRIYPVNFYDSQFCKDVFKMSPFEMVKKLENYIYKAEEYNDGVIIMADLNPLSVEEAENFDKKVQLLLNYSY